EFDHEPASDFRVNNQGLWALWVATNSGEPGEYSLQTKLTHPGRNIQPEWVDLSYQEKSIGPLTLIERHEGISLIAGTDFSVAVASEELASFDGLEISVARFHDEVVSLANGVPTSH